jgi:hypothetical protein
VFHTKGRAGLNTKQVAVRSNDPAEPLVQLTIRAQLEVALELDPRQLDFGNLERGKGATHTVRLAGRDAAKTRILTVEVQGLRSGRSARTPPEQLLVTRTGEGERAGTVEISVLPDAPVGPFHGTLQVGTDNPNVPSLSLLLQGVVRSTVAVRPERLRFRHDGQIDLTRVLMLDSTTDEKVRVLEVTAGNPALDIAFHEVAPGRTEIRVTLDGAAAGSLQATRLTIRTSSPQDPLIVVPVEVRQVGSSPEPPVAPPAPPAGGR